MGYPHIAFIKQMVCFHLVDGQLHINNDHDKRKQQQCQDNGDTKGNGILLKNRPIDMRVVTKLKPAEYGVDRVGLQAS